MPQPLPSIVQLDLDTRTLFFDDGQVAKIHTFVDEEGDPLPDPEGAVGIVFYLNGFCLGALLPNEDELPSIH
jgi:hypothetical protein